MRPSLGMTPGSGTTPTKGYRKAEGQYRDILLHATKELHLLLSHFIQARVQGAVCKECGVSGGSPADQRTDRAQAPAPSLIGLARPDPPPAHLKSDTAQELPRPGSNPMLAQGAEVFLHSRIPGKHSESLCSALLQMVFSLFAQPSSLGFRFLPACLQDTFCPSPLPPEASLRTPQSSGLSRLSVKKRVGSAISLRSISSAIFSPRPPTMRRFLRPAPPHHQQIS